MQDNKQFKLLEEYLISNGALNPSVPDIVQSAVDCINTAAVDKMKLAIAISELTTLTSHLRKPIQLDAKTLVPVNGITYILASSGASKDSSVNAVRAAFRGAYKKIDNKRLADAKQIAINKAIDAGEEKPELAYASYMKKPRPLMPALGTVQGMTSHFYNLAEGSIGAGHVSTNEVGSDLQTKKDEVLQMFTLVAKAYDLGIIDATIVKDDANQVGEIRDFPVNALLFGTESVILYDQKVKAAFVTSFAAQLARRSLFSYNPEQIKSKDIDSISAMLEEERAVKKKTAEAQNKMEKLVSKLVDSTNNNPLRIEQDVYDLYEVYKRYNELLSDSIPKVFNITATARRHKQWLALKLSGVLAILDLSETIKLDHYVKAINLIEIFNNDLQDFEKELIKEPYEQFVDYVHTLPLDNNIVAITYHDLKKQGFISSISPSQVKTLATAATSYDKLGIYTQTDDGILYKQLEATETKDDEGLNFISSYKEIDEPMSNKFKEIYAITDPIKRKEAKDKYKQYLGSIIKDGYVIVKSTFEDLTIALSSNAAISNYAFRDGIRGKEYLINETNWLLLDIDDSMLDINTVHYMLQDYRHHIVRGSDETNNYKFHIAIELSTTLTIDPRHWKYFIKSVSSYLGLHVDKLPQAQVMFCYEGREVLSSLGDNAKPLDIKDHLLVAEAEYNNNSVPIEKLTEQQKKKLLSNTMSTFQYAYEAENGEGSRSLIRAAYHAKDLGMNADEICELLDDISGYWDSPFPYTRMEAMQQQIRGMF